MSKGPTEGLWKEQIITKAKNLHLIKLLRDAFSLTEKVLILIVTLPLPSSVPSPIKLEGRWSL
jgi:hypothetical protein